MTEKVWKINEPVPVLQTILARELNISPVVAQLLINRGIYTVEGARYFFRESLADTASPYLLRDMDKAASRICRALRQGEKILVYGDYDADGVTATALLTSLLRRLGGKVDYYVPHRQNEGYGLHRSVLERVREAGYKLVITVDCGISNAEVVASSNARGGPDIIITDHHEPPVDLPPALAVINPKRPDCRYPFKELAGVGVALKLGQAVEEALGGTGQSLWRDYLDLVCVGTIADVVPLQGENRILVREGLTALARTAKVGLTALMQAASVSGTTLDATRVGFMLAPRLNAAGRLGDARLAVDLLLAEDYDRAWEMAAHLNKENLRRQKIEAMVFAEAVEMLKNQPELLRDKVIVLWSEGWHPGVIGIAAARLLEKYYRPVLLVALDGNDGKGSARSIPGFHIYRALAYCNEELSGYGGHALAAGFSVDRSRLETLRDKINRYADQVFAGEYPVPEVNIDTIISLNQIDTKLVEQLEKMSPYGPGNPPPLFACRNVTLAEAREVGKGRNHLKMLVKDGRTVLDGIGFNLASSVGPWKEDGVDLAFIPTFNHWNGKKILQLEIKDIKPVISGSTPHYKEAAVTTFTGNGKLEKEIFLPSFIRRELARCGRGEAGTGKEQLSAACENSGYRIEDWRGYPNRERLLERICTSAEKTVVVTNTGCQVLELYYFLTQNGLVGDVSALLPVELRGIIEDRAEKNNFATGEAGVLITTPDSIQAVSPVENLVFYSLPMHPEDFYGVINHFKPLQVYLLFGERDGEQAKGFIRSLAPGRKILAGFYNLLTALYRANRRFFAPADVIKILAKNGYSPVHEFSITVALQIFKELRLLEFNLNGKGAQFRLYPAPHEKLSLRLSPTYRYLQRLKAACYKWLKLALTPEFRPDREF